MHFNWVYGVDENKFVLCLSFFEFCFAVLEHSSVSVEVMECRNYYQLPRLQNAHNLHLSIRIVKKMERKTLNNNIKCTANKNPLQIMSSIALVLNSLQKKIWFACIFLHLLQCDVNRWCVCAFIYVMLPFLVGDDKILPQKKPMGSKYITRIIAATSCSGNTVLRSYEARRIIYEIVHSNWWPSNEHRKSATKTNRM